MSYYRQGPQRPGGPIGIVVPELTYIVRGIIVACVAVFLAQQILSRVPAPGLLPMPYQAPGLEGWLGVVPYLVVHGWLWQLVTAVFLHGGVSHILFNMLVLWMFGGDLEKYWGRNAFLRYFLVCGIGGTVFATLGAYVAGAADTRYYSTIGASGAIFGLLVAFGMIYGERTVLFFLIFPMKARTMVMILFAIQLFMLVNQAGGVADSTSWVSHVGGALIGYLYLKRAWRVREFYKELRWKIRRRKFRVMDGKDRFDNWVN